MADSISLSSVLPPTPVGPTNAALAAQDAAKQSSNPLSVLPAPKQVGPTNAALAAQHIVKPHGDEFVESKKTTAKTTGAHDMRDVAAQHGLTSGGHGSSSGHTIQAGVLALPLAVAEDAAPALGPVGLVAGGAVALGVAAKAIYDAHGSADPHLAPQPRAGAAPTTHGGVAADHPAAGTILEARRNAQTLAPSMPAGVTVQTVNCNKPPEPEYDASKKAFKGTPQNFFQDGVKAQYVKQLAATKSGADELTKLGFSEKDIKQMAKTGNTPEINGLKVEVHHILPLECGGTNDFDNLTLVRKDVHKYLSEAQLAETKDLKYGESKSVELLIAPNGTMYPNVPGAAKLPELKIP